MTDDLPCMHAYLEETARRMPERHAVVEARQTLTLGELHARAQALAAALVGLGVLPGDRVGLCLEKSADSIVALYATLFAGGIYVPIPPSWPVSRMESTLEQCDAAVVIGAGDTEADPPTVVSRRTGARSSWQQATSGPAIGPNVPRREPGDPAFVLFTSGSTGTPKGVTISHRAVGAFVRWTAEAFGIGPEDRVACPSPLSFDLSTLDVFNIAVSGAACVIVPEAVAWMPRLVTRFAREQGVTTWYSVPSILMRMLEEGTFERQPLATLRTVLFAGEVMPAPCAARLRAAYPRAELWNLYGPTETNVVTAHRLGDQVDPLASVPIGSACPYARLQLDPATVESRDGERVGELLVGGTSLMAGYWGRPDETARVVVQVEEEDGQPRPYYRTGDRVAERAGGVLSFVGRVDRQVKRRGVRIELGEIEAALAGAPGVAEAAAAVTNDGPSTLIRAFAAPREGSTLDPMALRAHCAASLPSYMMPDEILKVARLPRGSRGKVDYEALESLGRKKA